MHKCPNCGSSRVHYSRTKSTLEKWRRHITGKRPYRCSACRTRVWSIDTGPHFSTEVIAAATAAMARDPAIVTDSQAVQAGRVGELDLALLDDLHSNSK